MNLRAKKLLAAVAVKNNGDWNKEYLCIKNKEMMTDEEIEKVSHLADQIVTILDEDYPMTWKSSVKPPLVLFYKGGERSILDEINMFSPNKIMVSSVSVLDDGKDPQTKKIVDDILEHGGFIAIPKLDSGDIVLKNKTQSLTLSEYPYDAYDANSKEQRLRVIQISVGLCGKLFVGINKKASTVNIAVSSALNNGRDVYVAPTSLGTAYENNKFLREGANIALDWRDVISDDDDDDDDDDN